MVEEVTKQVDSAVTYGVNGVKSYINQPDDNILKTTFEFKTFTANIVHYDSNTTTYVGTVNNLPEKEILTFMGNNLAELNYNFRVVILDYLDLKNNKDNINKG